MAEIQAISTLPRRAIARTRLVDRLEADHGFPVSVITAPAGYGKTTLMLQLAERVPRHAYLRLSANHDDPAVLVHDVARTLDTIEPLHEDTLRRISAPSLEPGLQAATRLAEAISGFRDPAFLLLDDLHVLRDKRAADALRLIVEMLPPGMRVIAAGHDASALQLSRMRAADRLLEIGERDLAFEVAETLALARLVRVELADHEAAAIVGETEGWPVAVSLALHSIAASDEQGRPRPSTVMTHSVADYIRSEFVEPLDAEQRRWLLRSAVLEVMSGPLCDAALEETGCLARIRQLERSSLLIDRVDGTAARYRYHPLLRSVLREELEASAPLEARAIAARAARWCDAQGESLDALEYGRASEDRDLAAGLIARHVWALHWTGRMATLERWVRWFDEDGVRERYASVAVVAGFMSVIDGRRHEGELWLAAAENTTDPGPMPDGTPTPLPWVAMLRGMMCPNGTAAVEEDARVAMGGMPAGSPFMPGARLLAAIASFLNGRLEEAHAHLRETVDLAQARGAMPGFAMAIGTEAALALRRGQRQRAQDLIDHALDRIKAAGLVDYVLCCLIHAVAARLAIFEGSAEVARHHLAHVHRSRPLMTASAPWLSLMVRSEAIEALLALGDIAGARTLLREVDDILRIRPEMGLLGADAEELRRRVAAIADAGPRQWTLTTAELRVLQYLPTHLTFAEIAERLYVSPHTIKSQAVAIYSKLGVSTRRAAIETAVEVGLLDGSALRFPLGADVEAGIG